MGYAADADGFGIAYARLVCGTRSRVLRAQFRTERREEDQRAAGFAALVAISPLLRKYASEIELQVDDAALIADLTEHRELPVTLLLAYVHARCALNAFGSARLVASTGPNDLTARAQAEVSMRIAA